MAINKAFVSTLESLPWRHTDYSGNPHEYVMQHWSRLIDGAILTIRPMILNNGVDRKFFRATFRCLRIGDYEYWMMPHPTPPYVLNRVKVVE